MWHRRVAEIRAANENVNLNRISDVSAFSLWSKFLSQIALDGAVKPD
jgi:hypothetical protein